MFSALLLGNQIYILDKKNGPTLKVGEVTSISATTVPYNQYNPNNYLDPKVNIKIKVENEEIELKQVSSNLSIMSNPSTGIVVAETKDLIAPEVDNMIASSLNILNNIPYHKAVVEKGEVIKKMLNPQYAKEQEREEDIANLKSKVGSMESKLDKIYDLLSKPEVK